MPNGEKFHASHWILILYILCLWDGNGDQSGGRTGSSFSMGSNDSTIELKMWVCNVGGEHCYCSLMLPIFSGDKWEAKRNNAMQRNNNRQKLTEQKLLESAIEEKLASWNVNKYTTCIQYFEWTKEESTDAHTHIYIDIQIYTYECIHNSYIKTALECKLCW